MVKLPYNCERCGKVVNHYGRCSCLPGVLTIRYGDETVTVDPMDPRDKFDAASKRAGELLALLPGSNADIIVK